MLFERLVRAGYLGGSGIGLSIARDLVEAHSGTISAGNATGGGAIFTIRLP